MQSNPTRLTSHTQQFVYLRESFTPSLDEQVQVLFQAYSVDGRLVVNYALVPAWG